MAVLESRPFRAPSRSAVDVRIELVEPSVPIDEIADSWEPGQRIVLRYRATLSEDFWAQTGIAPSDPVKLVALGTCLPARARWRESAPFERTDDGWSASTLLTIDGSIAAVELTFDAWIVGPGRTGSDDSALAIHEGAKLWQLPQSLGLQLQSEQAAFPTTAISFGQTGRQDVPWTVEANPDAEPHWHVSSSIRLYVNTDSELAAALLDGSASEDFFALVQCDIQLAVLHRLALWRDSVPPQQMQKTAELDVDTLAALGASIAQGLSLPLAEALRLAAEEPLRLSARSREALRFGERTKRA
jgi:hypothetical protein